MTSIGSQRAQEAISATKPEIMWPKNGYALKTCFNKKTYFVLRRKISFWLFIGSHIEGEGKSRSNYRNSNSREKALDALCSKNVHRYIRSKIPMSVAPPSFISLTFVIFILFTCTLAFKVSIGWHTTLAIKPAIEDPMEVAYVLTLAYFWSLLAAILCTTL